MKKENIGETTKLILFFDYFSLIFEEDGHTYERESISEWLSKNGTSPISREKISKDVLIVNRALKTQIEEFKKQKGILPEVKQKVFQLL